MARVRALTAATLLLAVAGCEVVGTIFRAGVWMGVILVVAVLALVGFLVAKLR